MDRQPLSSQDIRRLMDRGKFWEIFGFSSGDFTTLELAKQYSALTRTYHDSLEDKRMIDDAFATLNAPLTRQFYEGCRMMMQRIRSELGNKVFDNAEGKIWLDLWNWVSERWQEPPEELLNAIKNKYIYPGDPDTVEQTQIWSDEGLKPADLDSVMAAEAFQKEIRCQSCGKFDHTLRVVAFPYVVSILIASFKRVGEAGIFCHRCRCSKSLKWAIVSLLFGWWSIWGFFWTLGALVDNFRGGKMPGENNMPLISRLAWAHMALGKIGEAKTALQDLLKIGPDQEALQLRRELDTRYPEISPARTGEFRLGYLAVVFAVLGMYIIAGAAMFGGTSTPSTYTPPPNSQPATSSPSQPPVSTSPQSAPSIPPSDSYVEWDDSSGWTTGSTITVTGSVRNTHDTWSMTSVMIEVEMKDKYSNVVKKSTVIVSPSTIPPGGIGRYYQVLNAPAAAEDGDTAVRWIWTPP